MTHVVLNALSLRPGGGLQVAIALVTGLLEADPNYSLTVLWSDPRSLKALQDEVGKGSRVDFVNPVGTSKNILLFAWQMTRLKSFLSGLRADVCIGLNHHFPIGDIPQIVYHVNLLRFERSKRAIWSGGELADRLRDWRAKVALTHASANPMESGFLLECAKKLGTRIKNAQVIYIGQRGARVPQDSTYQASGPQVLLCLTSPQPHKDNPTLIRTLNALCTDVPDVDWQLEIAGGAGAESMPNLVTLSEELGVSDRVQFLGFQGHSVLAKKAQSALCVISTSRVESFSMISLEAMAWSCPPVVADASAMPESIGDAGLKAKVGDPQAFALAVRSLYENPEMRQDLISRGHARLGSLTWSASGHEFAALISQVLADR